MSSTNTYTPLVIVCGGDDNFAMPTGVMLHSALLNLTPGIPVAIHVMSNGIKLASQAMIQRVVTQSGLPERNVSLSFLSVDTGVFEGFKTGPRHLNVSAYMRLLMPDLLPDHQRAIYLDADMVVHGNLAELWEQDFAGKDVWQWLILALALPRHLPEFTTTTNWGLMQILPISIRESWL